MEILEFYSTGPINIGNPIAYIRPFQKNKSLELIFCIRTEEKISLEVYKSLMTSLLERPNSNKTLSSLNNFEWVILMLEQR